MQQIGRITFGQVTPVLKPITFKSKAYLDLVRTKGCLICGLRAEPHHITLHDARWGGKSSDLGAIPLCRVHHDIFGAHPKDFGNLATWEQIWECLYWLEREFLDDLFRRGQI